MRLLLIRHGDPDYLHDTLTERGAREAQLLSGWMTEEHVDEIYKSPMGRAAKTASYTEEKLGMTGVTLPWLQEFPSLLDVNGEPSLQTMYPDTRRDGNDPSRFCPRILWDMLPAALAAEPQLFDPVAWRETALAKKSDMAAVYDAVTGGLDDLLASHGYVRDGLLYRVARENRQTLALFCHFGVSCVLLSHLWNVSPFALWHHLCLQTSSLTELVTEEREKGVAQFRALRLGDITHLRAAHVTPSFAARFTDIYSDADLRH